VLLDAPNVIPCSVYRRQNRVAHVGRAARLNPFFRHNLTML
jgi:hypothetical protein